MVQLYSIAMLGQTIREGGIITELVSVEYILWLTCIIGSNFQESISL
jgi:hypothetical protein